MELLVPLDPAAALPLHRQLYEGIRAAILTGRLHAGERLPSSRSLADSLQVARNTVNAAYEQLAAEGYLATRTGSGTYVSRDLPDDAPSAHSTHPAHPVPADRTIRLAAWGQRVAGLAAAPYQTGPPSGPPQRLDFRHGRPDATNFPIADWRHIMLRQLQHLGTEDIWYGPPTGSLRLRRELASYLGRSRGVRCTPDQIIVTTGTQQSIDIITRLLVDVRDTVAVENPCYPGARRVLEALGARLVDVPVDHDGLIVEALPPEACTLAYTTPSHQYPTGATMPVGRRLDLLDWARRTGAVILEDDYDSEFRHTGRPVEALQGLDRGQTVAYIGSFSKVLYPALRMGYLVVPQQLLGVAEEAKRLADLQTATPPQEALAEFLSTGLFEAHLRRMRRVYRERRAVLLEQIKLKLAGFATAGPSGAGLYVLMHLDPVLDERKVVQRAAQLGVALYRAGPYYAAGDPPAGLIMGYAALDAAQIADGIERVRQALQATSRSGGYTPGRHPRGKS
ncbi:MAG: PLP-dependent aminotransferase family protein [Chloroflexota bacterium]